MRDDLSRQRARGLLLALLFVAAALYAVPIWWGLPSYTGWAVDEVVPSRVLTPETWSDKYPPLHRYLLTALFGLWDVISDSTGLERYTELFVLARSLSLVMALATVWLAYRISRQLVSRRAALFATAVFGAVPSFVYYAKTANLEAPYLFWFAVSLHFYLKILRRQRLRDYLWFGVAAALSVGTKDQAYALYLAIPAVLVGALAARAGATGLPRLAAGFVDRRLWLGGACSAAVFLLVHNVLFAPEAFLSRIDFLTGAPAVYRTHPSTLAGHLGLAGLSLHQLVFLLGLLATAAGLVGLGSAVRRLNWRLLTFIPIGLVYYLAFIAPIGYNYPRFLLPVALLAAPFCGLGLDWLWRSGRGLGALAVGLVLVLSFVRAVTVDLSMVGDSRYAVERWLREAGGQGPKDGYGTRKLLPRGLRPFEWGQLIAEPCRHLAATSPEHVVATLGEPLAESEERALGRLESGQLGYDVALRQSRPRAVGLLGLHGVASNLDRVAPETIVWRQTERPCFDDRTVLDQLAAAAAGQPIDRAALAAAILDRDLDDRLLYGSEEVVGVNLQFGRWTRGDAPAGVALRNSSSESVVPWLEIGCLAPPNVFPVTVRVDDGIEPWWHTFTRRGKVRVPTTALAPGGERLLIVQADRGWRAPGEGRVLGVSLLEVALRPASDP